MNSDDYKKMFEMLNELSNQYRKAAKESLGALPGEFHRLLTLAEKAEDLASDLEEVYWRKLDEEEESKFNGAL